MFQGLPWVRLSVGILISVAACIAILVRVDLNDVLRAFRDARYEWIAPAVAVSFLTMAIRAERWRLICQPVPVSYRRSFWVLSIGASLCLGHRRFRGWRTRTIAG